MARAPAPLWTWLVAGWLVGATLGERRAREPPPAVTAHPLVAPDPLDPARMSVRALRTLPGVGRGRALAATRARWRDAGDEGPLRWEDVPGIGPRTAAAIDAWCAERGLRSDGIFVPAAGPQSSSRHSLRR